jgi:hypothetical protein
MLYNQPGSRNDSGILMQKINGVKRTPFARSTYLIRTDTPVFSPHFKQIPLIPFETPSKPLRNPFEAPS